MFDWENTIALHAVQGNRASWHGKREVSWVFLSCGRKMMYILELRWGCTFETGVWSVKSRHLSRYEGQLRNVNYAWQDNWELEVKWEFSSLFLFEIVILGCLTILENCQASSKFEAVNSTWLSSCQRHVRPLF